VAEGLVAAGHDPAAIRYVGAVRGIEQRLLPETPFAATYLDVDGFQRSLGRTALRRNLAFGPKLWRARARAIALFEQWRPRVVVSVGGYASMPAVLAARHHRVPVVVVSYDRFPGRASAWSARRAAACAVAFPDSPLPRATLTGAPLRRVVLEVDRERDRAAARAELDWPDDRFVLAVTGGSQGSGALNAAVARLVEAHGDDPGLFVHHVVGERFLDQAPPARDGTSGVAYRPVGYERRMDAVYAGADLLLGRGGASTVHEVAATGIPAVLVPWAEAAEDHQTANVRWLADAGAAVLLPEAELATLTEVVARWRADEDGRRALGDRARSMGDIHRRGAVAELVRSVALA
jgi:UDP-N-acetylglucosamine--N-acetylmuramyl-(pentapeptide) pyrophosphoryl-undecaprenol N-acetylglucosamine transferase